MMYLLVFAFNVANLEPVVLKDCMKYDPAKDDFLKDIVTDFSETNKCEQVHGVVSWTCADEQRGIITKITLMKDLKQCKEFSEKSVNNIRKLLER